MHTKFYKLMQQLSKPAKVASTLDWKKVNGSTLLSLNIHRNRIGIAVASHPSYGENCHELEPLRFADDHVTIDKQCLDRFQRIVEENKVCGIVVSWPLQHDTGRMGAACGRVLYALEEIIDKSPTNNILSPSRPLCLWDSEHIIPKQSRDPKRSVDSFGRCASYGNTSEKVEHRASEEQYHEDENTVVVRVWEDFCREHWPELYRSKEANTKDFGSIKTEAPARSSSSYGTSRIETPSPNPEQTAQRTTLNLSDLVNKKRSLVQMAR